MMQPAYYNYKESGSGLISHENINVVYAFHIGL